MISLIIGGMVQSPPAYPIPSPQNIGLLHEKYKRKVGADSVHCISQQRYCMDVSSFKHQCAQSLRKEQHQVSDVRAENSNKSDPGFQLASTKNIMQWEHKQNTSEGLN